MSRGKSKARTVKQKVCILGSKLTQMTKGTDTLYFTYDAFGAPWTVKWNGTVYNYMTNLQGDIIAIVNTSNVAVVEYVYDAWGNVLSISGSMANTLGTLNPLTYRGYVYDHETQLYYLQSRYYNPEWGRFLNADAFISTGGLLGNNMFAYCNNNPVNYIDSTGKFAIEITVTAAGMVTGVVICGVALAYCATMAIVSFLDWLADQWYYRFARITYIDEANDEEQSKQSEHTKNKRPSTKQKHQQGQTRKGMDGGKEKGDKRRINYRLNKKKSKIFFLPFNDEMFFEDEISTANSAGSASSSGMSSRVGSWNTVAVHAY